MLSHHARVYKCALVTYVDCMIYPLSTVKDTPFRGFQAFNSPGRFNVKQSSRCVYILCGCYYFTSAKVKKNLDEKAERNSSMGTELRVMITLLTSYEVGKQISIVSHAKSQQFHHTKVELD